MGISGLAAAVGDLRGEWCIMDDEAPVQLFVFFKRSKWEVNR